MQFEHEFKSSECTYFALTYPFSYNDCQELLSSYESLLAGSSAIYFNRELLSYSKESRHIDLLTITSTQSMEPGKEEGIDGLFPLGLSRRPHKFKKDCVFVTARVHPGEVQGSHMLNGLLSFLLRE